MNEKMGPVYIRDSDEAGTVDKPFSKALHGFIDLEARKLVTKAYEKTEEIIKCNKDKLEKVQKLF